MMTTFVYKVLRSFIYAFKGILSNCEERNMKVHLFASVLVVLMGLSLGISLQEWFTITILIGLVFAAEMMNTAVEELSNIVRDELKLSYKATQRARDVAAGAVFVIAIVSAIIGTAIFLPKVMQLFTNLIFLQSQT